MFVQRLAVPFVYVTLLVAAVIIPSYYAIASALTTASGYDVAITADIIELTSDLVTITNNDTTFQIGTFPLLNSRPVVPRPEKFAGLLYYYQNDPSLQLRSPFGYVALYDMTVLGSDPSAFVNFNQSDTRFLIAYDRGDDDGSCHILTATSGVPCVHIPYQYGKKMEDLLRHYNANQVFKVDSVLAASSGGASTNGAGSTPEVWSDPNLADRVFVRLAFPAKVDEINAAAQVQEATPPKGVIIGASVGGSIAFIILLILVYYIHRNIKHRRQTREAHLHRRNHGLEQFRSSLQSLLDHPLDPALLRHLPVVRTQEPSYSATEGRIQEQGVGQEGAQASSSSTSVQSSDECPPYSLTAIASAGHSHKWPNAQPKELSRSTTTVLGDQAPPTPPTLMAGHASPFLEVSAFSTKPKSLANGGNFSSTGGTEPLLLHPPLALSTSTSSASPSDHHIISIPGQFTKSELVSQMSAPPATDVPLESTPSKATAKHSPVGPRLSRAYQKEYCHICLDPLTEGQLARQLPCQHTFHQECIDKWLVQFSSRCPLCKFNCDPYCASLETAGVDQTDINIAKDDTSGGDVNEPATSQLHPGPIATTSSPTDRPPSPSSSIKKVPLTDDDGLFMY
ncbi:hypothetical protein H4R33_004533 [Dimargaris cristalligena]|nr:hypothetical protein H4R33_004533 [Dimargaris cristalligena]